MCWWSVVDQSVTPPGAPGWWAGRAPLETSTCSPLHYSPHTRTRLTQYQVNFINIPVHATRIYNVDPSSTSHSNNDQMVTTQ